MKKHSLLLIILALFVATTIGCSSKNLKPTDTPKHAPCEFLMRNTAQACATVQIWEVLDASKKPIKKKQVYKFKLKGLKHMKKGSQPTAKKIVIREGKSYVACISFCRGEGKKPFTRCQAFGIKPGYCKMLDKDGQKYKVYINIEDPGEADGKGHKRNK